MLTEEERRRNKALAPANPQIARTQQMLAQAPQPPPPAAAKLSVRTEGLMQRNPQLAATSGVAAAVPPAAANITAAPQVRRFNSGIPGVQGPAMPTKAAQVARAAPAAAAAGVGATLQQPAPVGGGSVGGMPQPQLTGRASGQAGVSAGLATPPPVPAAPVATPNPVIAYTGDGKSGKANAAAPGQVGLSELTQKPLPGAPKVGADGSVQYDDNWQRANQALVQEYAQRVTPMAGAQGSMLAQAPQTGQMQRAQGGFTQQDRAMQADSLDRLGAQYRRSRADDQLKMVRLMEGNDFKRGLASVDALMRQAESMTANPRVGQIDANSQDANALAQQRLGLDAQRLGMEQQNSMAAANNLRVDTKGKELDLKQKEQMAALTEMLTSGDATQRAKAAADIATLTGTKQGQPIKLKQQFDTGQRDIAGNPLMGEKEILVDWNGNRLDQDQRAQLPQGVTPEQAIAEAQKEIASGRDPDGVRRKLAQYGLSL